MPDSFIPLAEMKEQLGLTADQSDDDALIQGKINAAENHIDRLLGYSMRTRYPAPAGDPVAAAVPPALKEAVLQLAAWWFENRETVNVGNIVNAVPFGVSEIINEYRDWSF